MSFETAFTHTVGLEGGYSDNPNDAGGETNFGITVAVARANGYAGAMRDLPLAIAQSIYRKSYWDALSLDAIDAESQNISEKLFDTGVNMGIGVAAAFLQTALNAFNRQGVDYPDVPVDGHIGAQTVDAFKSYLAKRGTQATTVMLRALIAQQGARYLALAKSDPKDENFEFGWFLNRVM